MQTIIFFALYQVVPSFHDTEEEDDVFENSGGKKGRKRL